MKRNVVIAILSLAACLVVGFIARPVFNMGSFFYASKQHKIAENKVSSLSPTRIDQLLIDSQRLAIAPPDSKLLRDNSIPKEFSDLAPSWVSIAPDQVMIEFLGGFDHLGVVARQSETGQWQLFKYTEEKEIQLR